MPAAHSRQQKVRLESMLMSGRMGTEHHVVSGMDFV